MPYQTRQVVRYYTTCGATHTYCMNLLNIVSTVEKSCTCMPNIYFDEPSVNKLFLVIQNESTHLLSFFKYINTSYYYNRLLCSV